MEVKITKKKYLFLILTIICILSINTVNANDLGDSSTDVINEDVLQASGSFGDLAKELEGKTDYTLTKNYTFSTNGSDDAYKSGIILSNSIKINGNGFTIDGSNLATAFNVEASNVVLNNITFINAQRAIFINSNADNCIVNNSIFYNNSIIDKSGGAILWSGANGILASSNFINNTAQGRGGAVFWGGYNGFMFNCNFTKNTASDSGAVMWLGDDGTISYCNFVNNTAHGPIGALQWDGKNGILNNSNFINNTAETNDCGAIDWVGSNGIVDNSNFIGNRAIYENGAIQWRGENGSVFNSNFSDNYADGRAGAIKWETNNGTIANCNFVNNHVETFGGALYLFGNNFNIVNVNFTGNLAPISGGAIFSNAKINIIFSNFDGNIASQGSAIYNNRGHELYVANTTFGKNRADSRSITIEVEDLYHRPEDVTVNILFKGEDNIANAIWNNNDPDYVTVNNVTYEVFISGDYYNKTTNASDVHPVLTWEASSGGEDIWQGILENAQLLNLKITNEHDEVILSETGTLTDLGGNITRVLSSPEVGLYKVFVSHTGDAYYTDINETKYFEVVDVLNTTKVTDDTYVTVGDSVTYTITIKNTEPTDVGNVTVVENIPDGFVLVDYSSDLWYTEDNIIFKYNGVLEPNGIATLKLTFITTIHGRFTNTIGVSSNITNEVKVNGNKVIVHDPDYPVHHPNMTVSKIVDYDTIFVGDKAVFTINVTNTGDERLANVFVVENFDENLIFDNFTNLVGEWSLSIVNDTYIFTLPSLRIDGSASFKVYFNTTKSGFFVNNVTTGFNTTIEANFTSNVSVVKIPTKVGVENITCKPGENITIPINLTSEDNSTVNTNVTVTFPDGSNKTVEIINNTGNVTWTVPDNYTGEYNFTGDYDGNETYEASNDTGVITVIPMIPTHIITGNLTCNPLDNVTIPITVTADDGIPFNGNISVNLPDGTNLTVEVVNGNASVNWTVPEYYNGTYEVHVSFDGDNHYLPSNDTGFIYVPSYMTHITVGNLTCKPGDNVTIPITVTADDGVPFNGNITVILPDGTNKTVEIINGKGSVNWIVPKNYKGKYDIYAFYDGYQHYLPSNGIGILTVIPSNSKHSNPKINNNNDDGVIEQVNVGGDDKVTGNPLIALIIALALLGFGIKRKK